MSRATAFTAVPGWGGVLMGVTAIVAAAVSGPPDDSRRWVLIWLADAAIASRSRSSRWRGKRAARRAAVSAAPAHRFALAYVPPLVAGTVLTPVFVDEGLIARLPGAGCCCTARRRRPAARSRCASCR